MSLRRLVDLSIYAADGHDHTLNPVDRCPTVRAIEEALS